MSDSAIIEKCRSYINGFDGKTDLVVGPHMLRQALEEALALLNSRALDLPLTSAREVTDGILVGGNHLASVLIAQLGGDFASKYPPDMDPGDALRIICATPWYDVWCCWAAIMRSRNALASAPQPACVGVGEDGGGFVVSGWLIRFRDSVAGHATFAGITEEHVIGIVDRDRATVFATMTAAEDVIAEAGWTEAIATAALSPAPSPQAGGENLFPALVKFFSEAFHVSCQGDDLDGSKVQERGVQLGLLVRANYDPKKHGHHDDCDPGDDIYIYSDEFKVLLHALSPRREG